MVLTTAPPSAATIAFSKLIGDQIADTRIKLGRALEVGEKERETDDLEALVDGKRVGAVKIAKSLVGESRP